MPEEERPQRGSRANLHPKKEQGKEGEGGGPLGVGQPPR